MPRWLRWLTYAHDPEAHRMLDEIRAQVEALTLQAKAGGVALTIAPRVPILLDCGDTSESYATNGDGRTECLDHYNQRLAKVRARAPRVPA